MCPEERTIIKQLKRQHAKEAQDHKEQCNIRRETRKRGWKENAKLILKLISCPYAYLAE